jgi:hypothetical protein
MGEKKAEISLFGTRVKEVFCLDISLSLSLSLSIHLSCTLSLCLTLHSVLPILIYEVVQVI